MNVQEFTVKDYRRHYLNGGSSLIAEYAVVRSVDLGDGPMTISYRKASLFEALKFEVRSLLYRIKRVFK